MIAVPAVDLHGGRCVQLVGGSPKDKLVSLPDPASVARRWSDMGFNSLHVVDLEAALDAGDNAGLVAEVLAASPADAQVGGGVRTHDRVETLLALGATRVVVGTRAVDDRAWLEELTRTCPGKVVVAADVRDGTVLRKGWTEKSALQVESFLATLADLPLAGLLYTDVAREGRMEGIDLTGVRAVVRASPHPVQMSGGITSLDDLSALADAGAAAAVIGMALYTGRLDAEVVAKTYGSEE